MCQNGQDELPRAVGSTRSRARTEFSGRRGSAQPDPGQARQKLCAVKIDRSGFGEFWAWFEFWLVEGNNVSDLRSLAW